MLTLAQLTKIMPLAGRRAVVYQPLLAAAMTEFEIIGKARETAFLAQIAHESLQLVYTREIASGIRYEGRIDLGNTQPGDGMRFRGRGLIQITGRANYIACMMALGIDCVEHPELLEEPEHAARSAAWFWRSHGLNQLADKGDQRAVTRRVNGGYNGLAERLAFFDSAQKAYT